jgi:hypothetical protein
MNRHDILKFLFLSTGVVGVIAGFLMTDTLLVVVGYSNLILYQTYREE